MTCALSPLMATAGLMTRQTSRDASYATAVSAFPDADTSAAGIWNVRRPVLEGTFPLTRTSVAASGDHPSGSSPAKPCAPTAVSVAVVPAGTAPEAIFNDARRVTVVSPP